MITSILRLKKVDAAERKEKKKQLKKLKVREQSEKHEQVESQTAATALEAEVLITITHLVGNYTPSCRRNQERKNCSFRKKVV